MLTLASDGIFPIVKNKNGQRLSQLPASGFDIPGTIQGEGKLNGIPSLFIRLAGCNLRCRWQDGQGRISDCDTAYASYEIKNTLRLSIEDILQIVRHNKAALHHLVITGGEPFLQARELTELCKQLKKEAWHLTVETNATLYDETLVTYIDFFSLSPKLSSSVTGQSTSTFKTDKRINLSVIQQFITHARTYRKDFQLKFVYAQAQDIEEIEGILTRLHNWEPEDVLLMPLGTTPEELFRNTNEALKQCIIHGWRFCDRLHISLFGNRKGV